MILKRKTSPTKSLFKSERKNKDKSVFEWMLYGVRYIE
jgi:hypothetical protein